MRLAIIFSFTVILACTSKKDEKLTIATAANVQFAMKEIVRSFEAETGIECEIILGSSGQLNAQIKSGAPYDIFVSANMKYPNDIFENNLAFNKPSIYAYGVLVIWSRNSLTSIYNLDSDSIQKIAIANPFTAPYGEAAIDALKKSNLMDHVSRKLVYGESISQVNQFVMSNSAEAGFTSKSVVVSKEHQNKGSWIEVDQNLYKPIEQGIVVLNGDHVKEAERFFAFMLSENGKTILKANGYRVN
jgi:molybdate transport system substrate-binding protein